MCTSGWKDLIIKYRSKPGSPWKIPVVLAVVFILSGILGCGKASAPPVREESLPDFPKARYLSAEGYGETKTEARQQAMAELSSIFEARIFSQVHGFARSSLGPDHGEEFEKIVEARFGIASSVRLQGAMIGRVWQDESTGVFHALAVLDRNDAGRGWSAEMALLDNKIQGQAAALETLVGPLPRMAALNRFIGLAAERQVIESRLIVVGYPVIGGADLDLAGDIDLEGVMKELAGICSDFRIHVTVDGDHGEIVRQSLVKALTLNGVMVAKGPEGADALISGRVEVSQLDLKNAEVFFFRAMGYFKVIDPSSQSVFAQINEDIRKGHIDRDEAVHKAVSALSEKLSHQLGSILGLDRKQQRS